MGGRGAKGRPEGAGHGRNGAWAERTANMPCMVVTLDVLSKLSGWLNASASCPVERGALKAGRVWARSWNVQAQVVRRVRVRVMTVMGVRVMRVMGVRVVRARVR